MDDKQTILSAVDDEFRRWETLLGALSEAQMTVPLRPSHWTIKDIVAHLHAWQLRSIARLEAALADREPQFPDWPSDLNPEPDGQPHDVNAWLYDTYRDQPWSQVYQQWRDGFRRFLALGAAIPEEALLAPGRYPWMEGYPLSLVLTASFEHHHQDHLGPLLIWLWEHGLITFSR
jgi:hypothetical protein